MKKWIWIAALLFLAGCAWNGNLNIGGGSNGVGAGIGLGTGLRF